MWADVDMCPVCGLTDEEVEKVNYHESNQDIENPQSCVGGAAVCPQCGIEDKLVRKSDLHTLGCAIPKKEPPKNWKHRVVLFLDAFDDLILNHRFHWLCTWITNLSWWPADEWKVNDEVLYYANTPFRMNAEERAELEAQQDPANPDRWD